MKGNFYLFENLPPETFAQFKQVKGIFSKHPYFFFSQFKQVRGIFTNRRFWVSKSYPFVLMSEGKMKGVLQCQDYQRKRKRNGHSFGMTKSVGVHTTNCAVNVGTNVSKVSKQLLYVARNITPKEVLNQHLKATNSTIRVKAKNYTRLKLKRRIKRKIAVFDTLFIRNKVLLSQFKTNLNRKASPINI